MALYIHSYKVIDDKQCRNYYNGRENIFPFTFKNKKSSFPMIKYNKKETDCINDKLYSIYKSKYLS